MIARLSIERAAPDRLFDYEVPAGLSPSAEVGSRVKVFLSGRAATGFVVETAERSAFGGKLKAIVSVDAPSPLVPATLVALARWMAGYYLAPLARCLEAVLPAPVRTGDVREKARLFVEAADAAEGGSRLSTRQAALLADIRRVGGGWMRQVCEEFQTTPATLRKMQALGALAIAERRVRRDPLRRGRVLPTRPLALNDAQAAALRAIVEALPPGPGGPRATGEGPAAGPPRGGGAPRPILLFGVTGSGKTEVYLQAIAAALDRGLGAIVLVPEISLTPQTVMRFASRFGDRTAVLHSALSAGERFDEWQRIRRGEARVVVGPRSAVFAPVGRLGLVVVDEEHEPSYKQEDAPRYSARDVAVMRAHIEGCAAVLGSATPSLESWHNAETGKYALARLPGRAGEGAAMPLVRVVDMREENAREGRANVFSKDLLEGIGARLERGEQVILFLNRRGYATSLACPSCGCVETCGRCDLPYTYHRADDCLRCHVCGGWKRPPARCPGCGDGGIRTSGVGTQRVEAIVRRCFPRARVARMDADSTSRKLSHDDILAAFKAGQTDVLIGTQMIAKGLHFPRVTLVGIVNADSSLHIPDFRAGERTFQLLAQVSGRTGRGSIPGEVVVQTYTPGHPAVQMARTENFEGFASQELPARRLLRYPPFSHLTCVTLTGPAENLARRLAGDLRAAVCAAAAPGVDVSEVCPAALAKADNLYRFQMVLRGPGSVRMTAAVRAALRAVAVPPPFRASVDVDAYSF